MGTGMNIDNLAMTIFDLICQDKYRTAEPIARKFAREHPSYAHAHYFLGKIEFWKENYDSAESEFCKNIEMSSRPGSTDDTALDSIVHNAIIARKRSDIPQAEELLEIAVAKIENCYEHFNSNAKASVCLEATINSLSKELRFQEKYGQAVRFLESILGNSPELFIEHELALTYMHSAIYGKNKKHLDGAVRLTENLLQNEIYLDIPDIDGMRCNLVNCYLELSSPNKAIETIKNIKNPMDFHKAQGSLQSFLKNYDLAIEEYGKAMSLCEQENGKSFIEMKIGESFYNKARKIKDSYPDNSLCKCIDSDILYCNERALEYYLKSVAHTDSLAPKKALQRIRQLILISLDKQGLRTTFNDLDRVFRTIPKGSDLDSIYSDLFLDRLTPDLSDIIAFETLEKMLKRMKPEYMEKMNVDSLNDVMLNFSCPLASTQYIIKTQSARNIHGKIDLDFLANLAVWNAFKDRYLAEEGLPEDAHPDESQVKVVQPRALYKNSKGEQFSIIRRAMARTLMDKMDEYTESEINDVLSESAGTLAKLHALMTPLLGKAHDGKYKLSVMYDGEPREIGLEVYDPVKDIDQHLVSGKSSDKHPCLEKLVANKGSSAMKQFLAEQRKLADKISSGPKMFIHSDLHQENMLEGGVLLDFGSVSVGNPLIDTAHFSLILNQPYVDYFINSYAKQLRTYPIFDDLNMDLDWMRKSYVDCRVHKALKMFGTSLRRNKSADIQMYFSIIKEFDSQEYPVVQAFLDIIAENKKTFDRLL
jgi:tetratricopeptide (TPR) repeat protein